MASHVCIAIHHLLAVQEAVPKMAPNNPYVLGFVPLCSLLPEGRRADLYDQWNTAKGSVCET